MITTTTGKNQITVPAAIVEKANIRKGTRLDWQIGDSDDTLIVKILPDRGAVARMIQGQGREKKQKNGSAVARLVEERVKEAIAGA